MEKQDSMNILQSKPMQKEMNLIKADVITSLKLIAPVFFLAFFIALYYSTQIISWILSTVNVGNVMMVAIKPFETISMMFSVSFSIALLVSSPILLWRIAKIVKPALFIHERKIVRNAVIVGLGMFFTGTCFAYFIFAPAVLQFMGSLSIGSVINMWSIQYIFSFIISSITVFGIMFQLPILMVILQTAGIIKLESMKSKHVRIYTFIGVFIFSAILTPQDWFTMFLMGIPLYCLYELGILACTIINKRRRKYDRSR